MGRIVWSAVFGVLLYWSQLHAAILEIPNHDTVVSGIGVISGWKCEVEGELTIVFDDGDPISLLYGSERKDTEKVCGDEKNGFVAIWNWGNLSEGTHTAVVYDNEVEFDRSTFDVVTYKMDFLRGAFGQCDVQDFPARGEITTLVWNQSTQHFELDEVRTEMEEPIEEPEEEEEDQQEEQQDRVAALHQEVENNNVPAARVLLEAGADPNVINPDRGIHHTALHRAVSHGGSMDMVELLLQHGADPNIPSSEFTGQYTALHRVFDSWLQHWQEDVLMVLGMLLDAGANVQTLTNAGETPLHRAVSVTTYQLARGSDWRLAQDVWEHVRTVFQTLLDAGADINTQGPIPQGPDRDGGGFIFSEYGKTVLHYALEGQHTFLGGSEIVEFLLDSGADPNLQAHSIRGRSVRDGLTETFVEEIVPDKTAFLYAMSGANVHPNRIPLRIVQLFLDAGADPNIPDADGLTALFYMYNAKRDEREEIERALIAAGADPTLAYTREDGEVISYTCLTEECQVVQDAAVEPVGG